MSALSLPYKVYQLCDATGIVLSLILLDPFAILLIDVQTFYKLLICYFTILLFSMTVECRQNATRMTNVIILIFVIFEIPLSEIRG